MLWGFFKKLVIADRIGVNVRSIFQNTTQPMGLTVILGLIFYGIQLYCDFSGGIDVIRGSSECFGIGVKDNFRQPYFSLSLGEFWRRWHISLGQWMKDYIFYPVSISNWMLKIKSNLKKVTNRKTANRITMAISDIIVFLLVGIWHGTGTNFCAWGLYNGIILAISAILVDRYASWKKKLKINVNTISWGAFCLIRTLVIVTIGWVFDCADTACGSIKLFVNIFNIKNSNLSIIRMGKQDLLLFAISCSILLAVEIAHEKNINIRKALEKTNFWVQVIVWSCLIQFIAIFGRVVSEGGFMYANF